MPFTPAHAVVALPFLRTPLVPAAIAIGAMAPDVPLFFKLGLPYSVTHNAVLGAVVGIPLALALLLIWRLLLRQAVPQLTPRWFGARLPRSWDSPWDGWWTLWGGRRAHAPKRVVAALLLAASLLIGIWSHILWDEFTHAGRWGGELIPALDRFYFGNELANWLHYLSSTVALTIIGIWALRWLRRRSPRPLETVVPTWFRVVFWLALPACLLASTTIALAVFGWEGITHTAFRAGTTGAAAILVVVALAALVVLLRRARHARDSAHLADPAQDT